MSILQNIVDTVARVIVTGLLVWDSSRAAKRA